jgi:hypothetical protein
MKLSEYQELYRKLATPGDIDFLAENFGYAKELLLVIHTQRVTRDTTRMYYRVKNQVGRLAYAWNRGEPILAIAERHQFPPVLMAQMLLENRGTNRKQFWKYLADLNAVPDARLRRELKDVLDHDIIYSPAGTEAQYARGRWGEAKLKDWLEARGVQYRTEAQLRGEFEKTPDALLKTPLKWEGATLYWIESKAIVGDPYEVKRHVRKQLTPYTELFGDGIVVYWFGFVEDGGVPLPEGVTVMDTEFFEKQFNPTVSAPIPDDFHRAERPRADASAA